MMVKKILIIMLITIFSFNAFANTPRSTGKYKNWESFVAETEKGKICFAQTVPTKRAPGAIQRQKSKLFVTFRPGRTSKMKLALQVATIIKAQPLLLAQEKKGFLFSHKKISHGCWMIKRKEILLN